MGPASDGGYQPDEGFAQQANHSPSHSTDDGPVKPVRYCNSIVIAAETSGDLPAAEMSWLSLAEKAKASQREVPLASSSAGQAESMLASRAVHKV